MRSGWQLCSIFASKIHQHLVLGASWGVLWPFWRRLGLSWRRPGRQVGAKWPSWARLGRISAPSWAVLDGKLEAKWPSWARLGAVLGGLGRDFGAKMGPKIDQKTDQKLEAISRSIFGATPEFLEPTCSDFGPSWAPWIFKNHGFSLGKTHVFFSLLEDVLEGNFFDKEARQEAEPWSKMGGRRGKCAPRGGLWRG